MVKDTFYFSHDYNARNDPKIKRLLAKHGMVGLGVFWAIIEDLYNNANALPTDYDSIAFDLRTDKSIIESVIKDFDLFIIDQSDFGSISVERRLNERNAKSEKARNSAFIRWSKLKTDANALQTHSDRNAIKESIVKESKEKDNGEFLKFWDLYGKKEKRADAKKRFEKLKPEEVQEIFKTLPAFLQAHKELQFRPYPITYLNQRRWEDELNPAKKIPQPQEDNQW